MPVVRAAIVQWETHPAFSGYGASGLDEPLPPTDGAASLHALELAGAPITDLRQVLRDRYVRWAGSRLEALLAFLSSFRPDLIVFPEYSIPPESLKLLGEAVRAWPVTVLAGTHTLLLGQPGARTYLPLGVDQGELAALERTAESAVTSVLPVLTPTGARLVGKRELSPPETADTRTLPPDPNTQTPFVTLPVATRLAGNVRLLVAICADAIHHLPSRDAHDLAAVVAHHSKLDYFSPFFQLHRAWHVPVLFANSAVHGGSTVVLSRDRASDSWWHMEPWAERLPAEDCCLVADIDLAANRAALGGLPAGPAMQIAALVPLLHPDELAPPLASPHLGLVPTASPTEAQVSELVDHFSRLASPNRVVLNRLRCLRALVQRGVATAADRELFSATCRFADLPSIRRLEARLARETLLQLSRLIAEAELPPQAIRAATPLLARLTDVVKSLPEPAPLLAFSAQVEPALPVIDRDTERGLLEDALREDAPRLIVLHGPHGIGKESVLNSSLARLALTPQVDIRLAPQSTWDYFARSVMYQLRLTRGPSPDPPTLMTEMLRQAAGVRFVIVIRGLQYALTPDGAFGDERLPKFLASILASAPATAPFVVVVLTSRQPKWPGLPPKVLRRFGVGSLDEASARRLLRTLLVRGGISTADIAERDLVEIARALGGYPAGLVVAAEGLRASRAEEVLADIQAASGPYADVIRPLVEGVRLTSAQERCLFVLAITHMALGRSDLTAIIPDLDATSLDSLVNAELVRHDGGDVYRTHEFLRPHFARSVRKEEVVRAFHRALARLAGERFQRAGAALPEDIASFQYHGAAGGLAVDPSLARELLDGFLRHADEAFEARRYAEARPLLHAILTVLADARVLRMAARAEAESGDADRAIALLREYLALAPEDAHSAADVGLAVLRSGRLDRAIDARRLAETADSASVWTAWLGARIEERRGDRPAARKIYDAIVSHTWIEKWPFCDAARFYHLTGSPGAAAGVLERVLRVFSNFPLASNLLASAYLVLKRPMDAERVILKALNHEPSHPDLLRTAVTIGTILNRPPPGIGTQRAGGRARTPRSVELCEQHLAIAVSLAERGHHEAAEREFKLAHRSREDNHHVLVAWAEAKLAEARVMDEDGYVDEADECVSRARRMLERVLTEDPVNPSAQSLRARIDGRGRREGR